MVAAALYGTMALGAMLWWSGPPSPSWLGETVSRPARVAIALGLGLAFAVAVLIGTRVLVRRTRWARKLHLGFREVLGPMSRVEIAFFALSSGVAEELLFRGAMQSAWGIVPTVLIFGLAHVAPEKRFLPWTGTALVAGAFFGVIMAATGEIVGVIVAHVLINYENLHFVQSYDPARPRIRATTPPGLVGDRVRVGGRSL